MKKTMETKQTIKARLLSFTVVCSLAMAFVSCANEDVAQNPADTDDSKNLTTFAAGEPVSRTSMTSNGVFYWEAGDKIYVKDDNNTWQESNNSPSSKTASFKFKVPGQFTAHTTYKVYYPGHSGSNNQVNISATQTQSTPNTTTHFGDSGDCGVADATGGSGMFNFTLAHQAAYLIFQPYTENTGLNNCYLTKIEVSSDNNIMGSYTFDPTTGKLTGTGTGKQIVLITQGSGSYAKGFPLTNTAANLATNGAYMVIKPGTYALTIRFGVKDYVTGVEGAITKVVSSRAFDKNKYYNIVSELDVKDYDGNNFYMWDAKKQYWEGYEWTHKNSAWQPTVNGHSSSFYPNGVTDSRWYHTGAGAVPATETCKDFPNVNELTWYAKYGSPRWDGEKLWTLMGHLYKGGMWFKKKSVLISENKYDIAHATDGRDVRYLTDNFSYQNTPSTTLPSASETSNYFFLPATGTYSYGAFFNAGTTGYYWSSSSYAYTANEHACGLIFNKSSVSVSQYDRNNAFWLQGFE